MSDTKEPQHEDGQDSHDPAPGSLIKTPKQLVVTIFLSFVIPVVVIILLVSWVTSGTKLPAGSNRFTPEATSLRIAPVAQIEIIDLNAPKLLQSGQQVYAAVCSACHDAGVAGAYKFADQVAWGPVIATGLDSMTASVINGKGVMPARGGNPNLDDLEIARAVVYLTNAAGANFEEPAEVVAEIEPAPKVAMAESAPEPTVMAQVDTSSTAPEVVVAVNESAADLANGKNVYNQACVACHAAGVAGAHKLGDKVAWGPAVETGMDTMIANVIKGKGIMPARGGLTKASDQDISDAVYYMVEQLN